MAKEIGTLRRWLRRFLNGSDATSVFGAEVARDRKRVAVDDGPPSSDFIQQMGNPPGIANIEMELSRSRDAARAANFEDD